MLLLDDFPRRLKLLELLELLQLLLELLLELLLLLRLFLRPRETQADPPEGLRRKRDENGDEKKSKQGTRPNKSPYGKHTHTPKKKGIRDNGR